MCDAQPGSLQRCTVTLQTRRLCFVRLLACVYAYVGVYVPRGRVRTYVNAAYETLCVHIDNESLVGIAR